MVWVEQYKRYVTRDGLVFSATRGGRLKLMKQYVKPGKHGGYLMTSVDRKTTGRSCYPVHRLIAIAFIDNPNNYTEVDHIDRNRQNNNIANLRWVSRTENCMNTGRGQKLRCIGIKAGTTEYQKWYKENHRDELKEYYHKKYLERTGRDT